MHDLAVDPAPLKGHEFHAPGYKGENSSGSNTAFRQPYRESRAKGNGEFDLPTRTRSVSRRRPGHQGRQEVQPRQPRPSVGVADKAPERARSARLDSKAKPSENYSNGQRRHPSIRQRPEAKVRLPGLPRWRPELHTLSTTCPSFVPSRQLATWVALHDVYTSAHTSARPSLQCRITQLGTENEMTARADKAYQPGPCVQNLADTPRKAKV